VERRESASGAQPWEQVALTRQNPEGVALGERNQVSIIGQCSRLQREESRALVEGPPSLQRVVRLQLPIRRNTTRGCRSRTSSARSANGTTSKSTSHMFGIEYDDGTRRRVRATPSGFRSSSRFVPQGCAPLENSRRSTPGYVRAVPLGLAPVSLVRWRFMRLSTRRSNSQRSGEKRTLESWQALIDTKCGSYFMSVATFDS